MPWGPLGFVFLAVLIVAAYGPSLLHVARGDQISYLAELSSRHGFMETVFGTLDLTRTRAFVPGDELAFRPLFYFMMGLQKYVFGYWFMGWQAVAILAHLFTCAALYALLWRIRRGVFAFLGTALFALAPVNIEAVTWHHIIPYLVFAGCVLMVLRNLYAAEHDEEKASYHTASAVGWMVPAVFLYETGIWYALCIGVFLWLRGRRIAVYGLAALGILYAGLSIADLFVRHVDVTRQVGEVTGNGSFFPTLLKAALLGKWFLSALFFLSPSDLSLVSRMMVHPDLVSWAWPWGQPYSFPLLMGAVLLMSVIAVLGQKTVRGGLRNGGAMLGLCCVMAAGYLGVIVLGRINIQGEFGMRVGLYYPYNFLTLVFVIAALASSGNVPARRMSDKAFKAFCAGIILAVVVSHAFTVHRLTAQMARDHSTNRIFLEALDRYVKVHEKEPGFSFYVGLEYPGNYAADWIVRRGGEPGHVYSVAEALYFPQFTQKDPKYVIKFER
jgi:hypothetical protein